MTAAATNSRSKKKAKKQPKLSRLVKPDNMSLEDWQIQLRRQFGREQDFELLNVGDQPIFSEFEVTNPARKSTYCVTIRGQHLGDNFCTCPDFATNTLGTCKHIEFALAKVEQKRGGKKSLREGYQPHYSEIVLHYGAERHVRFHPGTECPTEVARLASDYFSDDGYLLPEGFAKFDQFIQKTDEIDHEIRCQNDVLSFVAEVRDAEQRAVAVREAFPRGVQSPEFQQLLQTKLYDYQAHGALFAAQAGRCLIGDEMGLGKTVQAIAAAEIMAKLYGVERVLIVCPTSLKHQWEREIKRFAERSTQVVNGPRQDRHAQFASDSFYKIINYDIVHTDLDLIDDWGPDLVILDEAQRIKNWETRVARSVKRIESPYAIVLTGTPLENRLEELISIVQFVDRFRLGPTFRLLHNHQKRDEAGKVVGYEKLDQIGSTLAPILMRRQKSQVLQELPERMDKNFFVPMSPLQSKMHTENKELVARIVQKWRRYKFLSESDKRKLMIGLQNMRMACDSSYLLDPLTKEGVKPDELATLLEEALETPDTKVVIFSQWTRMHELIVDRLKERSLDHVYFHGGVPSAKRKSLVDRFREDKDCRAFLSTDAGGVGLNLQNASMVVNMDLPWNPAVLEQRIGRVHRMGQNRPVQVVNFVAQGTIEHGMLEVLRFKKSLFAGVLDGGENEVFLGGSRLGKFMETVENATAAIPAESREQYTPPSSDGQTEQDTDDDAVSPAAPSDPWSGLLQAGMAFLQQMQSGSASSGNGSRSSSGSNALASMVQRDERTGESYLKLPVPPKELLDQAMEALSGFLAGLKK